MAGWLVLESILRCGYDTSGGVMFLKWRTGLWTDLLGWRSLILTLKLLEFGFWNIECSVV